MTNSEKDELIRLNKLVAMRGYASRREADKLIFDGRIKVDGTVIDSPGFKAPQNAKIELDAIGQQQQNALQTILLNKPVGYVSAQAEGRYKPAVRLLTRENYADKRGFERVDWNKLAPAGRLDIDSEGLLVLTSDGRTARTIIQQDSKVDKEYLVRFGGSLNDKKLKLLRHGLSLDGHKLKEAKVVKINQEQLKITLTEGRKRQIRRMLYAVDLKVLKLQRVRIGGVKLGNLPLGKWRFIHSNENF